MSLRSIFVVVVAIVLTAVLCAIPIAFELTWAAPAREGVAAQKKIDELIAENGWNGQIIAVHYDRHVRILMNDIPEIELEKIFPILHKLSWLEAIRIEDSRLSDAAIAKWKSEFPNRHLILRNSRSN